jgi:hypothetical protein
MLKTERSISGVSAQTFALPFLTDLKTWSRLTWLSGMGG